MRLAVILFNLGGPDKPEAVEPFLRNLFSDPAIIRAPTFIRLPLARYIAAKRAPIAKEIYHRIGGRSPILAETQAQAGALDHALVARGYEAKSFIVMRYWNPFSAETVRDVSQWKPDHIVLLPLYPQFSTTTTQSSLDDWRRVGAKLNIPTSRICCYPQDPGFVQSAADLVNAAFAQARPGLSYRLLLTAHGLPERIVNTGDPYAWQVEQTALAIVERLNRPGLDWGVCYQSRVGPLKWIGPATDDEIRRAGKEGKGVVIMPIAFVSEHSETLVELDMEYAKVAEMAGVPDYRRVPTVSVKTDFIAGLAELVIRSVNGDGPTTCGNGRLCPAEFRRCGFAL